jgi:hypothetical protein
MLVILNHKVLMPESWTILLTYLIPQTVLCKMIGRLENNKFERLWKEAIMT